MKGRWIEVVSIAALLALAAPVLGEARSPEQTVQGYMQAMQSGKYEDAYTYLSSGMVNDKDQETWAKETKYQMQMAELKIFKYDVFPARVEGDTAKVPNILSSQDKYLNKLGVDEYELYTLVKQEGDWRIDQQEQVIDKREQAKWFTRAKE